MVPTWPEKAFKLKGPTLRTIISSQHLSHTRTVNSPSFFSKRTVSPLRIIKLIFKKFSLQLCPTIALVIWRGRPGNKYCSAILRMAFENFRGFSMENNLFIVFEASRFVNRWPNNLMKQFFVSLRHTEYCLIVSKYSMWHTKIFLQS